MPVAAFKDMKIIIKLCVKGIIAFISNNYLILKRIINRVRILCEVLIPKLFFTREQLIIVIIIHHIVNYTQKLLLRKKVLAPCITTLSRRFSKDLISSFLSFGRDFQRILVPKSPLTTPLG